MVTQFKYAFRMHGGLRISLLFAAIVLNIVFGILGYFDIYGFDGKVTAVVFSSLLLMVVAIVLLTAELDEVRSLCSAPAGYTIFLTPVPAWKILLSRVIAIMVQDIICLSVSIAGVVFQVFVLNDMLRTAAYLPTSSSVIYYAAWGSLVIFLVCLQITLASFFACVASKSLFAGKRASAFWGVLTAIVAICLLTELDWLLAPFGFVETWFGIFTTITIETGANLGMILYLLLGVCKAAALFFATTYLMERKINL